MLIHFPKHETNAVASLDILKKLSYLNYLAFCNPAPESKLQACWLLAWSLATQMVL